MTFCPIYQSDLAVRMESVQSGGNIGLYFDKFPDAWQWDSTSGLPVFDPPPRVPPAGYRDWLTRLASSGAVGNSDLISEAYDRLFDLVAQRGGRIVGLVNETRFVTGTGLQHPTMNGFAWHRTLGVPYCPGSGVKGCCAAFVDELSGGKPDDWQKALFGSENEIGTIEFTSLLPISPVRLTVEVLTPHYGLYYSKSEIPGDWLSPVPIKYLTVEAGQKWICGFLPTKRCRSSLEKMLAETESILLDALSEIGIGAKTEVGFGRFIRESSIEDSAKLREQERAKSRAAAAAKRATLATASPQLATLVDRFEQQSWGKDIAIAKKGIEQFLSELAPDEKLAEDALIWLRKNILETGKNAGVWDTPDATKGKKNEPKYSKTIVELVKLIKQRK